MRTLILALLGGGALYFAWSQFGTVEADGVSTDTVTESKDPESLPTSIGTLQSMLQQDEAQRRQQPSSGQVPEDLVAPAPQSKRAGEGDAKSDEIGDLDLQALGNPLREGALLIHRPDDLPGYFKGEGQRVSSTRKKLLYAYVLLARGLEGQVPKYSDGLEEAGDVTAEEYRLLRTVLDGGRVRIRDDSRQLPRNPLILGATMSFVERSATEAATAGRWAEAATLLSDLLQTEIDAPWEADGPSMNRWASALADAQVNHRWSPEGSWPSTEVVVAPDDMLVSIRQRLIAENPKLQICTGLIERSNQLGRYLREGQVLRIPTDRVRTLIDLSARWLFYLHANEVVAAWPIAIGRVGEETTPGRYTVGEKTPEPPWFPRGRAMVPYGDPENRLGTRWIGLEGSPGLGIHGTWEPESIGTMASDGCIRLQNANVEALFEILPKGTEVLVRP